MKLDDIKKLGEINSAVDKAKPLYEAKKVSVRNQQKEAIASEFSNYMTSKGFTISKGHAVDSVIATYQNSKFELLFDQTKNDATVNVYGDIYLNGNKHLRFIAWGTHNHPSSERINTSNQDEMALNAATRDKEYFEAIATGAANFTYTGYSMKDNKSEFKEKTFTDALNSALN
ncbi:MAG: hypothetical protein JNL72_02565 [Flavipsychrobacter sp.]|nr:hypothetical protein [Flavipsychrobacter sp.]